MTIETKKASVAEAVAIIQRLNYRNNCFVYDQTTRDYNANIQYRHFNGYNVNGEKDGFALIEIVVDGKLAAVRFFNLFRDITVDLLLGDFTPDYSDFNLIIANDAVFELKNHTRTKKHFSINPVINDDDDVKFNHINIYLTDDGALKFDGFFRSKLILTAYNNFKKIMALAAFDSPNLKGWGDCWLDAKSIVEIDGNFFNENGDFLFTNNDPLDTLAVDINEDQFYFFANFPAESKPLAGFDYDANRVEILSNPLVSIDAQDAATNAESNLARDEILSTPLVSVAAQLAASQIVDKPGNLLVNHDFFHSKLAELNAKLADAKALRDAKQAAFDHAQRELDAALVALSDANHLIDRLGIAKAAELQNSLLDGAQNIQISFDLVNHNFIIYTFDRDVTKDIDTGVSPISVTYCDSPEDVANEINRLKPQQRSRAHNLETQIAKLKPIVDALHFAALAAPVELIPYERALDRLHRAKFFNDHTDITDFDKSVTKALVKQLKALALKIKKEHIKARDELTDLQLQLHDCLKEQQNQQAQVPSAKQLNDSLIRAMETNLKNIQAICLTKPTNLTAINREWELYHICNNALLRKEVTSCTMTNSRSASHSAA